MEFIVKILLIKKTPDVRWLHGAFYQIFNEELIPMPHELS
jgi:hypothetical protein